jgi:haloacid dehalogenase superfamily, subfamily IA, variant 1 with third motif having Dx(3-4)D or Dx(3-4)E
MTSNSPTDTEQAAILFDMDGVLLTGRETDGSVHDRALEDALAERDLSPDPETQSLLAGYEYNVDFVRGCRRLDIDPISFYKLRDRNSAQQTIDYLVDGSRTLHDVDTLEKLAEQYPLGVVSNNYDDVVRFVMEHYDLDIFDHVCGRAPGVRGFYQRKPNPHYLLESVTELSATNGLYVGDRETDVLAATRAGLNAVFVNRQHNEDETLSTEPTMRVGSLPELVERLLHSRQSIL